MNRPPGWFARSTGSSSSWRCASDIFEGNGAPRRRIRRCRKRLPIPRLRLAVHAPADHGGFRRVQGNVMSCGTIAPFVTGPVF